MTDLVQKLVVALEETLLFCETFSNRWDGQTGAHPFGMVERARAALSEAKAGGWQDISTAPEGTMILCANMNAREARDWCFVAWMAGGKVCGHRMDKPTHWQPLPAPPAQKEPT